MAPLLAFTMMLVLGGGSKVEPLLMTVIRNVILSTILLASLISANPNFWVVGEILPLTPMQISFLTVG